MNLTHSPHIPTVKIKKNMYVHVFFSVLIRTRNGPTSGEYSVFYKLHSGEYSVFYKLHSGEYSVY